MTHQDTSFAFIPTSTAYEKGKFGRLFPWLPPCVNDSAPLTDLYEIAELMIDGEVGIMPAGYTYLGQFLAHDLSFDPTSLKERQIDIEYLYNFRTPALDLDSMYGGGPEVMPYLYKKVPPMYEVDEPEKPRYGKFDIDLTRPFVNRAGGPDGIALIADPRNDENAIIMQLHSAFMLLHNKFLEEQKCSDDFQRFLIARQQTTWHFHWVVLWDYLPRIVGMKLVQKILKKRKYFDWRNEPFIPLEFSAATFRFGHSQVLDNYQFNKETSGSIFFRSPSEIPKIDWSLFFFEKPSDLINKNKRIGPHVTGALRSLNDANTILTDTIHKIEEKKTLPEQKEVLMQFVLDVGWKVNEKNLAFRNLLRGKLLKLPSGQAVAKAMKKIPLTVETPNFPKRLKENTPLWYYVLYESETLEQGKKLGPVGARIVAEVIIGLIKGDKTSFLNQDPNWIPRDEKNEPKSDFSMADLLKVAGVYEDKVPSQAPQP